MEKTYKEILKGFGDEIRVVHTEKKQRLKRVDELDGVSNDTKKRARKEIIEVFNAKMEEIKSKPWYQEALKSARNEWTMRHRMHKAEKHYQEAQEAYEYDQIHYRWKVENKENADIPPKLKAFRKKWEQEIDLDTYKKRKIINAVNKIQKGVKEEPDLSMLVEFELSWKTYKNLNVNVANHSDSEYLTSCDYNWQTKREVKLCWMRWDDPRQRKNKKLGKYVEKEKNDRGMEIRTVEFLRDLINKLWDEAGLTEISDKIAMWMYLTWNIWKFWWTMWNNARSNAEEEYLRSCLFCFSNSRWFFYMITFSASVCLIACE